MINVAFVRVVALAPAALFLGACQVATPSAATFAPRPAASAAPFGSVDWPAYGYDRAGTRASPATQITPQNVAALTVAWTYRTGETAPEFATRRDKEFEATPIVVDGAMYLGTPLGRVISLDPASGAQRWVFDPKVDRDIQLGDFANRGVTTWLDPAAGPAAACARRIFIATVDARLIALDARTGTPCSDFGTGGTVDLTKGLRNAPRQHGEYAVTSPPAIAGDLVIVGSTVGDNTRTDAPSGEVRAFDVRTGALRWTFDPVPQDSLDPQYGSWRGANAHHTGAANTWSEIAVDSARGLVILPTTSPSPDYYGGERLGDNRYASSVVALRASTGKVVWHFQTVHHDLWDYDNAAPPALLTIQKDGRARDVVVEATKTGQLFVLDRDSGEPVFPVEERAVPRTDIPGEQSSPTQPFNTVIAPLSPQGLDSSDVWGATPAALATCRDMIRGLRNDGVFTPPALQGTLVRPSNIGGVAWGGVAFDQASNSVIVEANRVAAMVQLIDTAEHRRAGVSGSDSRLGYEYTWMRGTPYVMRRRLLLTQDFVPCTKPPFSTLMAIDLGTGARRWEVPLGSWPTLGAAGAHLGTAVLGGPIVTRGGVVFQAGMLDRTVRAFDVKTGRELWHAQLPAGARMTPMTYVSARDGRQYVVVTAGGGKEFGAGDYVIAFALPASSPATR